MFKNIGLNDALHFYTAAVCCTLNLCSGYQQYRQCAGWCVHERKEIQHKQCAVGSGVSPATDCAAFRISPWREENRAASRQTKQRVRHTLTWVDSTFPANESHHFSCCDIGLCQSSLRYLYFTIVQFEVLYFTVVFPCDTTFYISEGNIVLNTPLHLFNSFSYFSDEDLTQWII